MFPRRIGLKENFMIKKQKSIYKISTKTYSDTTKTNLFHQDINFSIHYWKMLKGNIYLIAAADGVLPRLSSQNEGPLFQG